MRCGVPPLRLVLVSHRWTASRSSAGSRTQRRACAVEFTSCDITASGSSSCELRRGAGPVLAVLRAQTSAVSLTLGAAAACQFIQAEAASRLGLIQSLGAKSSSTIGVQNDTRLRSISGSILRRSNIWSITCCMARQQLCRHVVDLLCREDAAFNSGAYCSIARNSNSGSAVHRCFNYLCQTRSSELLSTSCCVRLPHCGRPNHCFRQRSDQQANLDLEHQRAPVKLDRPK